MEETKLHPKHEKLMEEAEERAKAEKEFRKVLAKYELLLNKVVKRHMKDEAKKFGKKYEQTEIYKKLEESLKIQEKYCKEELKE